MSSIVICGGSGLGLATGMLLARDGHDVTVLEADPAEVPTSPAQAWNAWRRKGVPQFRQPHTLYPRFQRVLDDELPGLVDELREAGCVEADLLAALPPTLTDRRRRGGDERFRFVTGRRPVVEQVFARVAEAQEGMRVRRGVQVAGLCTSRSEPGGGAVAPVTGVITTDGEVIDADLVVDAMGRRSPALDWLAAIGAPSPQLESSDVGFAYYTRYFVGPELPRQSAPMVSHLGTFSLMTLPGDNDTWSVTLFGSTRDTLFKQVRDSECFSRLIRACPSHAHWLQGEPVTDVLAMAGILDRYRRFVLDGRPVVTGFAAVGDAWACTNPSAGRGLSVGLVHAQLLRDVLREFGDDRNGFALAWDEATERTVTPYYRSQREADTARFSEMTELRAGRVPEPRDGAAFALPMAAAHDPELFRAFQETVGCLATS